jgi:hypothetical protein
MGGMSYLDDPGHVWKIDPEATTNTLLEDIIHLAEFGNSGSIELVLQGYFELKLHLPDATDEECFGTSMVWYFG